MRSEARQRPAWAGPAAAPAGSETLPHRTAHGRTVNTDASSACTRCTSATASATARCACTRAPPAVSAAGRSSGSAHRCVGRLGLAAPQQCHHGAACARRAVNARFAKRSRPTVFVGVALQRHARDVLERSGLGRQLGVEEHIRLRRDGQKAQREQPAGTARARTCADGGKRVRTYFMALRGHVSAREHAAQRHA